MAAKYIPWYISHDAFGGSGVDLPADLPRSALTTILHIKPDKHEPSKLKFVIVIWGVSRQVTYDMTVQC